MEWVRRAASFSADPTYGNVAESAIIAGLAFVSTVFGVCFLEYWSA